MKQKLLLLLLLTAFGLNAQNIYVKHDAAGTNDGSSWANAYTSLDAALTAATTTASNIWVAAGTYKPSTPAPNHSFLLTAGSNLYGGFAGTETTLEQRNIAANPTILNGDILGNDTPGNFTANRTDNATHVLVVFVQTTNDGSIVDGFTIRNGQTLTGGANLDQTRRGGGMLVMAKTQVRHCTFVENGGESGAALCAFDALGDQIVIEDCIFDTNRATEDGICYLRNTPTGSVKNCTFRNNNTKRGALYPFNTTNVTIDDCLFERNVTKGTAAAPNFGAGMFTWQATFTMNNCTFRHNKSDNAAGIYIDGREGGDLATLNNCLFEFDTATNLGGGIYTYRADTKLNNTIIRNNYAVNAAGMYSNSTDFASSINIDGCTFEGNVTTSYGGSGMYQARTNYTMSNTTFKNNIAPSAGAAIYHSDQTKFIQTNCVYEGNKASFAGAIANFGINCVGTYDGCRFEANQAASGGGAQAIGFKADITYKNCQFIGNLANYGAALFTQNDTTRITIDGGLFNGNIASGTSGTGGAVYVNVNIAAAIRNATFSENRAETGGAINALGDSLLTIEKCRFLGNSCGTQGAALNLNRVNSVITNTLFAKNLNEGAGAGGAISSNAADGEFSRVRAVNSTFADNFSNIGSAIAQWEGPTGTAELTLLNCMFQSLEGSDNYAIEDGAPEVFSLGGNQSSDATLSAYLTATKDLNETFNIFQDADTDNYAHTIDSPASNGGVADGAPVDDINGIPRYSTPDVGYREVLVTVGTHSANIKVLALKCAPNPSVDQTIVSFNNNQNGAVQISVWNRAGQQVAQYSAEKTANEFTFPLNVNHFAAGTYSVQVRMGNTIHEGSFAKF